LPASVAGDLRRRDLALAAFSTRRGHGGEGVLVAVLGFAVFSLTDHPSNVDRVAIALWITLGLAAGGTPVLRRQANA